ncbi:PQQ-like beta-propeller repeat protein [Roseovarius sp. MMSF_3281]|uniref:PQQ-like beta-propeller repeat protein n=1 Tax=Roseovarius sp. MMSF_3281 TaxID=3046694 RepID=UPI00273F7792|nr:PQQ-like beta-propeller repeat protein [Roseovarius sp. MMSF_3281]
MKSTAIFLGLSVVLSLAACDKREAILQGERENIRSILSDDATAAPDARPQNRALPLSLPAARSNSDWTQAIATPATRVAHPALGAAPQRIWSVNIGSGDGRRSRITADPVVAGGRVFTLDSQAQVSAVSTQGEVLWTTDFTPANDRSSDASGGGLAYGDGKLFVTSGFGLLTALDPATGAQIWQQDLDATSTGDPTVRDGMVYLVAGDEIAWAINSDTGRIEWRLGGTPDINNVLGGPAPAVTDKYAVFAFGAGELQGAFRKGGLRLWDAQVAGTRDGFASALVDDITGAPVVDGDTVYVGNHSGRTVALNIANGERLWTANEGPLNRLWPAGDSVFMISDRNELLRLSAEDGSRIWGQALPFFTKKRVRRQTQIFGHYGPVIAGGQLIVASSDEKLRFFDPVNGALRRTIELPGGATSNPVVAGQTLYVVSKKGQLHAFR